MICGKDHPHRIGAVLIAHRSIDLQLLIRRDAGDLRRRRGNVLADLQDVLALLGRRLLLLGLDERVALHHPLQILTLFLLVLKLQTRLVRHRLLTPCK